MILYGLGRGGRDVAIDVSFVCVEAHEHDFAAELKEREAVKSWGA